MTAVRERSTLSLHKLGVFCGLTAAVWLGTAEAPTKLVNAGLLDAAFAPFILSMGMVMGAFVARWTVPTLLKGTGFIFSDLRAKPHLIVWALLAGMLWAVANTLTIFAVRNVGLAIAFPLWNTNSLVGLFWGWLLFKELRGSGVKGWLKVLGGAFAIVGGAAVLAFAKASETATPGKAMVGIVAALGAGVLLAPGLADAYLSFLSGKIGKWLCALFCLVSAVLMARGLLHSYSRGAWLGTACGGLYLLWHRLNGAIPSAADPEAETNWPQENTEIGRAETPRRPTLGTRGRSPLPFWRISRLSRFNRGWFPLSVILLSVVILAFWHFRATDWQPARRALSAVNASDFSWRNRVTAWEGALQIMAEHPFLGAGWNQPEPLYESYYLDSVPCDGQPGVL